MEEVEYLKHYLYPSALFAEKEPHMVDTVLGSCVAVCIFDKKLQQGGINHYMLPFWNGEGLATPKYGNIAIQKLIERMQSIGSKKEDMIAKVFGGSNQINSSMNIGERNVMIAEEILREYKIPVIAKNIGGHVGRKMRFNTQTGEVLMKLLSK